VEQSSLADEQKRSAHPAKKITIAYTGKDAMTGTMKTEENTVEGPVMVFI
jgi:hypothetical protein